MFEFALDSLFVYALLIGCVVAFVYFYTRRKKGKRP
ncbi:EYxxD motif small membrane protein [Anaerobacillus isosaccharinicus]|uniref:EYxxD motif small membrane protein n=1 Tax=Anaerobacillus isosaccharinicus TaxID=1532552 RepID=A0AC62A4P5_9BACI